MNNIVASVPVLRWAAARSRLSDEKLSRKFGKWAAWLTGEARPTLRQLEDFARLTHTAIGYFFLPAPPTLNLPVPDFRNVHDVALAEPSTELLDVLYLCQQRQDWYRDYARLHSFPAVPFVGSARADESPVRVAARMREVLMLAAEERRTLTNCGAALRQLTTKAEDVGVLVMASSIVGSNSHRKLDAGEFRGFALADDLAPVVFLNGADSKAAQTFTLAHELAHLWLGASGVSDAQAGQVPEHGTERWCHQVAAELLKPLKAMSCLATGSNVGAMDARAGKRFTRAIVASALTGHASFTEAFRMLGIRGVGRFHVAARKLGLVAL